MSDAADPVVVGYSDRLSVAPGQTIRFMVSSEAPAYRADIVRLIHGDPRPIGPGFKEQLVQSPVSAEYPGRVQPVPAGSYVLVPGGPALARPRDLTLQAWIYATTPGKGVQGLVSNWSGVENIGYGLFLEAEGDVALRVGGGYHRVSRVRTGVPLNTSTWYFVAATFDAGARRATVYQEPVHEWPLDPTRAVVEGLDVEPPAETTAPLLLGAGWSASGDLGRTAGAHFNGKIDRPGVFGAALSAVQIATLKRGGRPADVGAPVLAAWDFSIGIPTTRVTDTSDHGHHGTAVNSPTRAVTGYNWTGKQSDFKFAPAEYGAIHFHEDDLDDMGWEPAFAWNVPADLRSGVYAARLKAGRSEDYVPFFVKPAEGARRAKIAFLAPTLTYLAYADATLPSSQDAAEEYALRHRLISIYNPHSDGSDNCFASRLRPLAGVRPKALFPGGPCHFSADLCLTDWLEAQGHAFDVITDEDLHEGGVEALAPYRVVITGSHPEYTTLPMLEGLESYLRSGGRLMYLGANGFYWVTSIAADRPHVMEIRRGQASEVAWRKAVGENYHSTTGELGGVWRHRGWPAQRLVGIGTNGGCVGSGLPYRRQPGSFDLRVAFIFDGVGPEEPIGDFGLSLGAAAGHEVDRFDTALGSPPHSLLLATATGFTGHTWCCFEDAVTPVRSDMAYFEWPRGGAVFSVGSLTWVCSLSHRGYDNNVSRITGNVLGRFLSDEPLP